MARFFFQATSLLPPFDLFDVAESDIPGGAPYPVGAKTPRVVMLLQGTLDLLLPDRDPLRVSPGCAMVFPEPCSYEYLTVPRQAGVKVRAARLRFLPTRPTDGKEEAFAQEVWNLMRTFHAPMTLFRDVLDSDLLHLLHRIEAEAEGPAATRCAMVSGMCLQWLCTLARLESPDADARLAPGPGETGLLLCRQFVRENISEPLTLERIAEHVGWSREHLARRFREVEGETLGTYIRRTRAETGREMLIQRGLSLEQIAQRCGFTDAAHFGRVFKAEFGVSPGRHRDRIREHSVYNLPPVPGMGRKT